MKRAIWCMLAWGMLAVAGASADDYGLFEPFRTIHDPSGYDHPRRAREGWFATFEGLLWAIQPPDVARIGQANIRPDVWTGLGFRTERSNFDTSELDAEFFSLGNRMSVGYWHPDPKGRWSCDKGIMVEWYGFQGQNQDIVGSDVDVVFADPQMLLNGNVLGQGSVRFPVLFDNVYINNNLRTYGVEVDYMWRLKQRPHGGYWELLAGARFFHLDDRFEFRGIGGFLDDSYVYTDAVNNIVGPQLGARWWKQHRRFRFSTEARFIFAYNFQAIDFKSDLGTNAVPFILNGPANFQPVGASSTRHEVEFCPIVDLRIALAFQVTKGFALNVGWSGLFFDATARASNNIDWTLPSMGILLDENTDNLLMQGLTLGFEFNR